MDKNIVKQDKNIVIDEVKENKDKRVIDIINKYNNDKFIKPNIKESKNRNDVNVIKNNKLNLSKI